MIRISIFSIAIVIIIYTGILLSKSDYPFGTILLTMHKLVSLAVAVIIGVTAYKSPSLAGGTLVFIITAVFVYILSFISGGITSAIEYAPNWVVWTHRIMAWFSVLTMILYATGVVRL